jgi:hypothetical protein
MTLYRNSHQLERDLQINHAGNEKYEIDLDEDEDNYEYAANYDTLLEELENHFEVEEANYDAYEEHRNSPSRWI